MQHHPLIAKALSDAIVSERTTPRRRRFRPAAAHAPAAPAATPLVDRGGEYQLAANVARRPC